MSESTKITITGKQEVYNAEGYTIYKDFTLEVPEGTRLMLDTKGTLQCKSGAGYIIAGIARVTQFMTNACKLS